MNRRDLKTVVLGLGRVAWSFHLPQILAHDGFELSAVVDPLPERLKEAACKFKVPTGYSTTEAMYAKEEPDLVVVASPTRFHYDQIMEAFSPGCDVFCDKPLACSLEETDGIIEEMNRSGRKLMVYQPHRVSAEAQAVKSILDSGLLGKVYLVKRAIGRFDRRSDWQAFRKNGGGMLNNYGAHYIDQFLYLNRSPFRKVDCELRAMVTLGDADDVVKATLTAENGVILDLDINMAAAHPFPPWYIAGTRGAAVFDVKSEAWNLKYCLPEELPPSRPQDGLAAANRAYGSGETIRWKTKKVRVKDDAALDFYAKCHDYFALDLPPFVPVTETREVMRAIELCRRSADWRE